LNGFYRIFAHIAAALRAFLRLVAFCALFRVGAVAVRTEPFAWHYDENVLAPHLDCLRIWRLRRLDAGGLSIGVAVLLHVLLGSSRFIYRASDKN